MITSESQLALRTKESLASRGFVVESHDAISALMESRGGAGRACLVIDAVTLAQANASDQERLHRIKTELPLFVLTDPQQVDAVTELIADRFERPARHELGKRYGDLTPRERQVMSCVASGLTNKEASQQLGVSPRTVEVHRARVMHKMGAQSLSELVRMAVTLHI